MRTDRVSTRHPYLFVQIGIQNRVDLQLIRGEQVLHGVRLLIAQRHFTLDFHLRFADPTIRRLDELKIDHMILEPERQRSVPPPVRRFTFPEIDS